MICLDSLKSIREEINTPSVTARVEKQSSVTEGTVPSEIAKALATRAVEFVKVARPIHDTVEGGSSKKRNSERHHSRGVR